MSDDTPPPASSAAADAFTRAVIAEAVSLGALALAIWLMGGGGIRVRHLMWRARQYAGRRGRAEDAAVNELRADISRYEHGQAAKPKPRAGGCGCAGAS
jgi:hypothetical protein